MSARTAYLVVRRFRRDVKLRALTPSGVRGSEESVR
jgi:hypothetical protein